MYSLLSGRARRRNLVRQSMGKLWICSLSILCYCCLLPIPCVSFLPIVTHAPRRQPCRRLATTSHDIYDSLGTSRTAMVGALCQSDGWRVALDALQEDDPAAVYDVVLRDMAQDRQWKDSVRLLLSMGSPSAASYEVVIEACIQAQQVDPAIQILQSSLRGDHVPGISTFELVIHALSQKLQWRRAMQVLDQLREPPTLKMYNSILQSCSKTREAVPAKKLMVQLRKQGLKPNLRTYNAAMAACAGCGRWKDALKLLDECHREPGVSPDIYSYTNAMRACAKGGLTRKALSLLDVAKDLKLPLDAYAYTAVIEACAKGNDWKKALELLEEMRESGINPTAVTFSVTISACGNGGQWQRALQLLESMRDENMKVNSYTYNAAITAISKAAKNAAKDESDRQLWKVVMVLLDQMEADGVEPDGFTYSAAIGCCGAEGRWEEALALMEHMQNGGPRLQPNKVAYTAAIASCGRSGQVDHALRLFRKMSEQGISADLVAYNAVFSAMRVAKKPDMAYQLWNELIGNTSNSTKTFAFARMDRSTKPDIITVTDAIGALSSCEDNAENRRRVDMVFGEAVRRGIVLSKDTLDSAWEIDLSGLSFPVARAACRYILNGIRKTTGDVEDLSLITGVGSAHLVQRRGITLPGNNASFALREYMQEVLQTDFDPPLPSMVPPRAQGTVLISSADIVRWKDTR